MNRPGNGINVLEEFWYGNLDPAEYDACPDEEKLLETMTDEQRDAFLRYSDCAREPYVF